MFREITRVSQVPGEPRRRWFEDDGLDLFVWYSPEGAIVGIQLDYEKGTDRERVLTWWEGHAISHARVDAGENRPGKYKMSPILVPDDTFDAEELGRLFEPASRHLEPAEAKAVADLIRRCAEAGKPGADGAD